MNKIDEKLVINNNKIKSLLNFCTELHKITNSFLLRPNFVSSLKWMNLFSDGIRKSKQK